MIGHDRNQVLPGSCRLAKGDGFGRRLLSCDPTFSSRGNIWTDKPGSTGFSLYRCEYCRRIRSREHGRLCSIAENCSGLAQGNGNPSSVVGTTRIPGETGSAHFARTMRRNRTHASVPYAFAKVSTKISLAKCGRQALVATNYCLLPAAYSLLTSRLLFRSSHA